MKSFKSVSYTLNIGVKFTLLNLIYRLMITKFNTYINESIKSNNIFDAASDGDISFFKTYNGDLNIKDKNGFTPLMFASIYGEINLVKYLIEHGVDLYIEDTDGYTTYYFDEKYFDSFEFQSWYMNTIGGYSKLKEFVQGNIHPDIKRKVINGVFQKELDQLGII